MANHDVWPAELSRAVTARLPDEVVRRAARYRDPLDSQAILLGRALLAALLARAGFPGDVADIVLGPHGKPILAGAGDFSIAHAGGRVVCALAARGRIGIDLEPIRPVAIDDYGAMFSDAERWVIAAKANSPHALLGLWTAKEAVAKASGTGLTGAVLPTIAGDDPVRFEGALWHLARPPFGPYALAVATEVPHDLEFVAGRLAADGRILLPDEPGRGP